MRPIILALVICSSVFAATSAMTVSVVNVVSDPEFKAGTNAVLSAAKTYASSQATSKANSAQAAAEAAAAALDTSFTNSVIRDIEKHLTFLYKDNNMFMVTGPSYESCPLNASSPFSISSSNVSPLSGVDLSIISGYSGRVEVAVFSDTSGVTLTLDKTFSVLTSFTIFHLSISGVTSKKTVNFFFRVIFYPSSGWNSSLGETPFSNAGVPLLYYMKMIVQP